MQPAELEAETARRREEFDRWVLERLRDGARDLMAFQQRYLVSEQEMADLQLEACRRKNGDPEK